MNWNDLIADVDLWLNKHFTPGRSGQSINKIVLHHNAGNLSIQDCWDTWQTREASAHYQVDSSGRIGQFVHDWDTAWHAGNGDANRTSIGIEHANNTFSPGWTINDATLDNGAHLVAALCVAYGLGRPQWRVNVFPHSDFSSTACPGAIGGAQNGAYMARAQSHYDQMTGKTSTNTNGGFLMALSNSEQRVLMGRVKDIKDLLTDGKGDNLPRRIDGRVRDIKDYVTGGGPAGQTDTLLRQILKSQEDIKTRLDKLEGK